MTSPPAPPPQPPAEGGSGDDLALHRLVVPSLWVGLSPLIPVPLVDDWARDKARRRFARELLVEHGGIELEDRALRHLAVGPKPPSKGCVQGCLTLAFLKPLLFLAARIFQKLFRKILFVLTIKDCADRFSHNLHETYLLRHALRRAPVRSAADVAPVRDAIDADSDLPESRKNQLMRTLDDRGRQPLIDMPWERPQRELFHWPNVDF